VVQGSLREADSDGEAITSNETRRADVPPPSDERYTRFSTIAHAISKSSGARLDGVGMGRAHFGHETFSRPRCSLGIYDRFRIARVAGADHREL